MKKSIIAEIYYGLDGLPVTMKMNKEQMKCAEKCSDAYDKLSATLNDEQKKILDDFVKCNEEDLCVTVERNFVTAFKLGLLVGIECADNYPFEED